MKIQALQLKQGPVQFTQFVGRMPNKSRCLRSAKFAVCW